LLGLRSEDNPERFESFGFRGSRFLQEIQLAETFTGGELSKISCGKSPGKGYKVFRSGVKTKLKFRCEQCMVRKGKKGKEVARGWTSINGTTMMIYKVDVPRKRI
jgi:hypothetical protein